jgi:single-strand DNA-binding protein
MTRKQTNEQSVAEIIAETAPAKARNFGSNRFLLLGRIAGTPSLRHTAAGKAVLEFAVATTVAGHPEFHSLVAWERSAEVLAQYGTKGRELYVEGRVTSRLREVEGHRISQVDLVVESFQLLGRPVARPGEGSEQSGGVEAA